MKLLDHKVYILNSFIDMTNFYAVWLDQLYTIFLFSWVVHFHSPKMTLRQTHFPLLKTDKMQWPGDQNPVYLLDLV